MIEILPNWHPIFVHFPIALMITSALLFFLGVLFKSSEVLITSKYCLWVGALSALVAVGFGWLAYNSVAHDTPSHAAMTLHRNWAIPTALFLTAIALFAFFIRHQWGKQKIIFTLILLLSGSALVGATGWLGAESVYRYGIGVIRIPSADPHQHTEGVPSSHQEPSSTTQESHH